MKKILLLFPLLFLTACSPLLTMVDPPITSFKECADAGNPVMESYPRQCVHNGFTYVEEIDETLPSPALPINEKACTREYMPVCGEIQVQCIKAPCPPIKTTFSNRCMAENAGAENITEGACIDENPNQEGACLSFDGNWIPEANECEGMSKEQCENLGGTFNECASACRNDPTAEMCTMQCVLVCQF